jgi:hypothetical protein
MDLLELGDLGGDGSYDSQEEKRRNAALGEEAKKSKRARSRSVGAAPMVDAAVAAEETPASLSKKEKREKRTAEEAEKQDPTPGVALAALAVKYKADRPYLKADGSSLHCDLCGNTFGTRASVWKKHLKSARHKKKLSERQEIAPLDFKGGSELKKKEELHKMRVADAFFEAGIELNKCRGMLKELLEEKRESRLAVGDASNLAGKVIGPLTAAQNEQDLRAVEAGGRLGSFIFDGYSRKDEHAAIVLRTCSADFVLDERLVSCKLYQKGLTGKQWLRCVDDERRRLGGGNDGFKLVFTMADGHPSNGIVGENLSNALEHYFHSFCYCHSLAKVGANCDAPIVDQFVNAAGAVFKNSPGARAVFLRVAGEEVKRKHKIRWFTTTEVVHQAVRKAAIWPSIVEELERENLCKEALPKLKKLVLENARAYDDLWIEMSAVYDATLPFYTATTFFEGTSFLAPFVWRYVRSLRQIAEKILRTADPDPVLPNVAAIIRSCPGHVNPRPLWGKARRTVDPGLQYFLSHFIRFEKDSKARAFRDANFFFAFARLFHPVYAKEWVAGAEQGTPALVLREELDRPAVRDVLLVLGPNIAQELTADFGRFLTCLERHVEPGKKYRPDDVLAWWKEFGSEAGSWAAAARLFTLLQPSSASAERVFSMLRAFLSEQQEKMLEDQLELRARKRFHMKKKSAADE